MAFTRQEKKEVGREKSRFNLKEQPFLCLWMPRASSLRRRWNWQDHGLVVSGLRLSC